MRNLTIKQKKLLKEWFNKNYPHNTGNYMFNLADKIEMETYEKIEDINPSEVFHGKANHFLEELVRNK